MTAPKDLHYPPGSLVLIAGLPGAGKSTLMRRLYRLRGDETEPVPAGTARVIDSIQSRNWWARYLGPLPPRARIPFVYTTHVWRIARALWAGHGVVAHTRGTRPTLLRGFSWLTRVRGVELHLVLLDVAPQTARAGQHSRGRVLTAPVFARHSRHWRALLARTRVGPPAPAASITVLDRTAADRLRGIHFDA